MESIDKLREYADFLENVASTSHIQVLKPPTHVIRRLADAIEREVDDMWHALTIDAKPMTDENMAESGWIRLPIDADGEVIHIGDLVDEKLPFGGYAAPAPIDTMELSRGASGYGWMVKLDAENRALINPKLLRHHRAPTVEDVLREFAAEVETAGGVMELPDATLAEYAAKLALRGDK